MPTRTLTAMYDNATAAAAARDALISAIPSATVEVRGGEAATDTGGFWESLKDLFVPDDDRQLYGEGLRRGGYLLSAQVPVGTDDQALDILEQTSAVDIDERSASWRNEGWTGAASGGLPAGSAGSALSTADTPTDTDPQHARIGYGTTTAATRGSEDETLEVVEEDLRVGKREVGRGSVRVRSYVVERPIEQQVELRQERVTIDRRPVDREIRDVETAFQDRTIEAVERGEEAVISKTARVTEEIGVRKDVEQEVEMVRDTVRKTEVEVEDDRTGHGIARDGGRSAD
jgi:uncharacterized protein (TIGR02271 family)